MNLLITLLILALIGAVIYWIAGLLPPPFKNIVIIIMAIFILFYLISLLTGYGGLRVIEFR